MIVKKVYNAPLTESIRRGVTYLEIETTGLSPGRHSITTMATAVAQHDALVTKQWIATTPDDEGQLLATVLPTLTEADVVVFHSRFLFPFIDTRAQRYGLSFSFRSYRDIRSGFSEIRPFYPIPRLSRKEIADQLEIPLPDEPNGEDVARIARRLYKKYDIALVERIAAHNLLHIEALYSMDVFLIRWESYLTYESEAFTAKLTRVDIHQDTLTANFSVTGLARAYLSSDSANVSIDDRQATLRLHIQKGMITETMPCLFVEILDLPHLVDRSGFRVPKGVLLVQVEDRYLPEALLDLLSALLYDSVDTRLCR